MTIPLASHLLSPILITDLLFIVFLCGSLFSYNLYVLLLTTDLIEMHGGLDQLTLLLKILLQILDGFFFYRRT